MKTRLWSQGKPVCVSFSSLSEFRQMYGGRESSTCYNFRKHMQIEKVEKEFHHFDSRWWKCSQHKQIKKHTVNAQHNQIHFICSAFLFWLCCEHLQRVRCKIEEVVFLISRCFFYLQCFFFGCAVSICSVYCAQNKNIYIFSWSEHIWIFLMHIFGIVLQPFFK